MCIHGGLRDGVGVRLADSITKSLSREVGPEDNKMPIIKPKEAWVGDDSLANVVERTLTILCPDSSDRIGVFLFDGQFTNGRDTEFKMMDVFALELCKANKLGNIPNNLRLRPCLK
jgi:hypothetical protein